MGAGSHPPGSRPDTLTARSPFFLMVAQFSALEAPHSSRNRSIIAARRILSNSAMGAVQRAAMSTPVARAICRSEEHTSELQSLMRNSYAVFGLKKKKQKQKIARHYK